MSLTSAYLAQVKNLPAILKAIRGAQAPEKFNARFLEDLGFKDTNDRLVLKQARLGHCRETSQFIELAVCLNAS
jgi:Family of unknown function (DUF5343)